MVNVAGGSQGFWQCHRRQIKCDKDVPSCKRCRKSSLVCGGCVEVQVKLYAGDPHDSAGRGHNVVATGDGLSDGAQQSVPRATGPASHAVSRPIEQEGELALIRVNYLTTIIGKQVAVDDDVNKCQSWIRATIKNNPTGVVSHATDALGAIHLAGSMAFRYHELSQARESYGPAVATLARNLVDAEKCYESGNLAAVLLLYFYEQFLGGQSSSHVQHHEGLAKLIEFFWPHRHCHWLSKKHLMMMRPTIILFAISSRCNTFLERHEWRMVPCANSPLPKLPMQKLLDYMAHFPGLLEESDRLEFLTPQ